MSLDEIKSSRIVNDQLATAAHSIVWSASMVRQIPELKAIAKMLPIKCNEEEFVDKQLQRKLAPYEPNHELCVQYLDILHKPPTSAVDPLLWKNNDALLLQNNDESLEERLRKLRWTVQ